MTKLLGDLVREPNKHGWKILNLFQIGDDHWRCNLHGPEGRSLGHTEFADGRTPEEAVASAIEAMHTAKKRGSTSAPDKRETAAFEAACSRLAKVLRA